ncbi:hypothetical protein M404DRAFT_156599 [Pisolithus tinctorius Marx 270]|uniref:Oxidoreductase AflY n=1 Tax=Pisolithus tinctorius Marx 270 TaxID=870435 RepID=A0A0C3IPH2_PISTI|nr:hypothetical protein M404DRAFT_156599 [Pisolithus tinctorius Marx 270]
MVSDDHRSIIDERYLDSLFPVPTLPPSSLSPQRFPGTSVESVAALQDVLKDNHKRWHIFFNHRKFHNHINHRALALYALGASGTSIRKFYDLDCKKQRPAIETPEAITTANFVDHLGDEKYYKGYATFFNEEIDTKGAPQVLEEYVFSDKFQYQEGASNHPELLARLTSGVMHSMIHVGYGLEFGLKGMIVEGLALCAVEDPDVKGFYPPSFFSGEPGNLEETTQLLSSLKLDGKSLGKVGSTHAFDVIARMLKDDHLKVDGVPSSAQVVIRAHGARVRQYAAQWTIDTSKPGEIERKLEELIWTASVIYAVGGYDEEKGFAAEFFLMHIVTSSLFLPSVIANLSPRSQELLLRAYLQTILTWWVARGRPALNIKSFMTSTPTEPASADKKPISNPFLPIIQSTIVHPDDHLPKIQRAFAHYSTLFGTKPAGYHKDTELEDAELLDGSLFVRAAVLTDQYMDSKKGETIFFWHMNGFFE